MTEVFEKWGFGMSPPKRETEANRQFAAKEVIAILNRKEIEERTESELVSISEVKGMFSRVWKEDQWDWFTVSGQLGYPSASLAKNLSDQLYTFRRAYTTHDLQQFKESFSALKQLPMRKCLDVFLGLKAIQNEEGAGWIYVLSTREFRDLLKIGMTTRTVEERVREINAATGVAIPYGVRGCWRVRDPLESERLIHKQMAQYRLRTDREFFRVDYHVARSNISTCLKSASQEIRTLNALTSLQECL